MIKVEIVDVNESEIGNAEIEVHGTIETIANEVLAVMCWFYDTKPNVFKDVSEHFKEHIIDKEDM